MSVFNFRGDFIERTEKEVSYSYYPDYFSTEEVFGIFKINPENWQYAITQLAIGSTIKIPDDERVVVALISKIKKYFELNSEFPERVYWNA